VKNGAEIGAHTARRFFNHQHQTPTAFLKIDFKNAFNMLDRIPMLNSAYEIIPELYPFLHQSYREPSNLIWNDSTLTSSRGVQQGDPLGPPLFCLAIQPIIATLTSALNMWYLDDGTLGGDPHTVLHDFNQIITLSEKIGLELNFEKCELAILGPQSNNTQIFNSFNELAPGISTISPNNIELLGAPLHINSIENAFNKKITALKTLSDRLENLPSHISFYLLKHSLSIPRLTYILRCSPVWKYPHLLERYDTILQNSLETITNCKLNSVQLQQITLPLKLGGLGIPTSSHIALPCFISSSLATLDFCTQILPPYVTSKYDNLVTEAIEQWKLASCNTEIPSDTIQKCQAAWEKPLSIRNLTALTQSFSLPIDQARILACQIKESGAWLNALPSRSLGTLLDNDTFRISIGLRLGCKICTNHKCKCGAMVDELGLHGLSCKKSAGRHPKHSMVNELIKKALISGGIPAIREPLGCSRSDGKRPDGLTLIPWSKGRCLIWDFTGVDTFAQSYLNSTALSAGSAAKIAEKRKAKKYESLSSSYIFKPVAIESSGVFGKEGLEFIKQIGKLIKSATGENRATSFLIQRISIAIQRGNAASILGAIPEAKGLEEIFYTLDNNLRGDLSS
jgi:hypothetical protein